MGCMMQVYEIYYIHNGIYIYIYIYIYGLYDSGIRDILYT